MDAEVANLKLAEYMEYVASQKERWDLYAIKTTGREEGREEGILDVACAMKANGATVEFIVKTTGLSLEEINKL